RNDLLRLANRSRHSLCAVGQDELRTQRFEHLTPLDRHRFRHGQSDRVTPGGRYKRERNAGIAAGWFDQLLARLESAALFGVPNHRSADPVLYRIRRIASLDLGEHRGLRAVGDAFETYQGRASDTHRIVVISSQFKSPSWARNSRVSPTRYAAVRRRS